MSTTVVPSRPDPLVNEHPELGPCEHCDDTGWAWDPGKYGADDGVWCFCKACKWRRR